MRVYDLLLPTDFVILDMEEDYEIPLLLGRPFLVIGGALINVEMGVVILRSNKEHVVFNILKP